MSDIHIHTKINKELSLYETIMPIGEVKYLFNSNNLYNFLSFYWNVTNGIL